ncbi:hypothetical protein PspTeo4_48584 [Pseudomonas sp. Teo4]|nr:hypothetical protein [Pseudomonas sp. Teo4]
MFQTLSVNPLSNAPSAAPTWEVRDRNGEWQPVEAGFDPEGLQPIGSGLWMFPGEPLEENRRLGRSLLGTVFRLSSGLLLENGELGPRQPSSSGWGERVMDDEVPGTEIYLDELGRYVFRHVGAYHHLVNGTAKYPDGSIGKETTLSHPDGRVSHASGHTVYPGGRSLDRRTGLLTDLGGNSQQLKRRSDGNWDVPASR